ncbi:MAG: exosome complex RNA-binding protein Csl4 [Candidatus Methanomethylicia archaeon]
MISAGDELVFPGDFLGVIEEFIAGDGVMEFDGSLFAIKFGRLKVDVREKKIWIESKRSFLLPTTGDVGLGVVFDVGFESAGMKIHHIEGKGTLRFPVTAYLRLHFASNKVKFNSMYDVVREGDIVRAVFLNSWRPYNVSIRDDDLGVIFARCPYCLSPLFLKDNKLICSKCNFYSSRKFSSKYLLVK